MNKPYQPMAGKRVLRDTEEKRYVYNVDRWMNYSRQKLRVPKTYAVTCNKITPKQMRRMKKKAYKNKDLSIAVVEYY